MSLATSLLLLSDQEVDIIKQCIWGKSHASFWGWAAYFNQLHTIDITVHFFIQSALTTCFCRTPLTALSTIFCNTLPKGLPTPLVESAYKYSKPWSSVSSKRFISQWTKYFHQKNFKRTVLMSWSIVLCTDKLFLWSFTSINQTSFPPYGDLPSKYTRQQNPYTDNRESFHLPNLVRIHWTQTDKPPNIESLRHCLSWL